jgi:hypothetical protein
VAICSYKVVNFGSVQQKNLISELRLTKDQGLSKILAIIGAIALMVVEVIAIQN